MPFLDKTTRRRSVRRILFARSVDADNINAQSRNAKEILQRWQSTEWRPTALAFREPEPKVAANPRVEVLRLSPGRGWRIRLWEIYQRDFDAIFYPGLHHRADFVALQTRRFTGRSVPVISTIEGISGSRVDDSRENFYAAQVGHEVFCQKIAPDQLARVEAIYKTSRHIISISPFLARLATARYGAKVSCLPLGIDSLLYRKTRPERAATPIVVCAGNVRAHKRPEKFLELAKAFPGAEFRWFGEGEMREPLQREAAKIGLTNLSYPGARSVPQLADEFARADILVLPSKSEGVPKVTQEAAAAGLAQIVFGYFEAPSVIDQVNGFVVWDDFQLAARLAELLASPVLVAQMGAAGVDLASSWSWSDVAPLWERRIQECAEGVPTGCAKDARFEPGKQ